MNDRIHYNSCPVCDSKEINPLLTIKDFSVSKESFVLWQCSVCSLRFTQDVPNENNIAPYYKSPDYISHTNTDKGFINKTYQKVRDYTLQQKAKLIIGQTKVERGNMLDIGSGTGAFLNLMKQKGWQVKGVEPDEDARKLANKLYNLQVDEPASLDNIPSSFFDAITLWHVLEHVHQLHDYVEQLKRLLKQKGRIFIAVPNYQSRDSGIYRSYWAAYDVPRHLWHFSKTSIKLLFAKQGMELIKILPMKFDSFYVSLLSEKYKTGKMNFIGGFLTGLKSNIKAARNFEYSSHIYVIKRSKN